MREKALKVFLPVALLTASALVGRALPAEAPASNPFTFGLGLDSATGETGMAFEVSPAAGDWLIHVAPTGNVNTLVLSIRDSSPGDFCWFWSVKRPKAAFTVTAEDMPAATLNACPGSQYEDTNGDALVFFAGFQGAKRAGVTITVAYP